MLWETILLGVSAGLVALVGYFIRQYITNIEEDRKAFQEEFKSDRAEFRKAHQDMKLNVLDFQKEINLELREYHKLLSELKDSHIEYKRNVDQALEDLDQTQHRVETLSKAMHMSQDVQKRILSEVVELKKGFVMVRNKKGSGPE